MFDAARTVYFYLCQDRPVVRYAKQVLAFEQNKFGAQFKTIINLLNRGD